ncbi:MAG: M6 family metalloprotease domain-containing protein [Candidatus Cloacimonadaceae bacterium]|jgi:M6 family metalloprotease-like protein|nr:M6 family metalloprotease domain-containing protein [Candidatus Cloacimonadota bacterium]MCK9242215.1 M6 family metalloprotease domain-containing protein [Candidatus Cloacimonadota bacterium]MDY0127441.1 M6 family metalloprotease domain-containing protein [Candidatus Cloacimonadaceae bacterium]
MKKMTYTMLFSLLALWLFAAPHSFLPLEVQQPDGSRQSIYASGDEFHNWLHDEDFYSIVQDDQGWYVYATQDDERVAPTQLKVGIDLPSQRSLSPGINLSQRLIEERYARMASLRDYGNSRAPHAGDLNNVVIFIRFSDDPEFTQQIGFYDNMFNAEAVDANSMKNYFQAASYGQLTVDSSFYPLPVDNQILCYVDSHPRNYYRKRTAANPIGYDEDDYWDRTNREHTLLANAVDYVEDQIPMSLVVDGDSDGYVDNVCFIIKGATEGWAELLWPHRWVLYAADAYIHGAQVWDFNFQLENSLNYSAASVLSHEMFHSLSAPDLYRYVDTTIDPIGSWDLMASNTNPPQHMSVWMKYRYGDWVSEIPWITQSGTYTLNPVASSFANNVYRVASWVSGESYVLEYRKPHGIYDGNIPGSGLLVYRLNPSIEGNADGPPDELYIYRPGGYNTTSNGALSQAAFSQQNNRTMITEFTDINSFSGNNQPGGLYLYNVGEAGETISFDIRISNVQLGYPSGGETFFAGTSKQIQWISKNTLGTVKLEFSSDDGNTWTQIADNVHNSGSYTWMNIPSLDSDLCRVRITLNSNGHSDTSIQPFSIISSMAAPQTIYPANMQEDLPTDPLFSWQEVNGAAGYYFELSTQPGFDTTVITLVDHPDTQYQMSGLTPYSTYYWRVAASSEIGISLFSDTSQFTTGELSEAPQTPQLMYPSNYASNQAQNLELSWQESHLAESYWLQIGSNAFFSNLVVDISGITQTSIISPLLEPNTTYFWRVAATNNFANSSFTSARRFSTGSWVGTSDELSPALQNQLKQNYPNPFNPHTNIFFSVKDIAESASLTIYNTKGQIVRRLFSGLPAKSELSLLWDGKDDSGKAVSSGIYLYRLQAGDFSQTRKMLLSK